MIVSVEAYGTNAYNRYAMMSCRTIQSEYLGLINLMFLLDLDYYYYVWFFTCAHIRTFFHLAFLIIGSPFCIQLYHQASSQENLDNECICKFISI